MSKKVKKKDQDSSMLGKIVDLPIEEFKEQIVKQKVGIGVINNLILSLTYAYNDLNSRKDNILGQIVSEGENISPIKREEMNKVLEGLYAEMTKIEMKCIYLRELTAKLIVLDGDKK